jgi:predicted phage terminase large subunit-like protein
MSYMERIEPMLGTLAPDQLAYLGWQSGWVGTARPSQIPPDTAWSTCGFLAGRGFGKTRIGAEWLGRSAYEDPEALPSCVVAPTQNDARFTCFEGPAGLLNVIPPECVQSYSAQDLLLTLNNGARIRGFGAEKADRLRGPEHARAWYDEVAAWGKDAQYTWDMGAMGMRIGPNPQRLWTTTPKPNAIVRSLVAQEDGLKHLIVRGATYDNRANLSESFIDDLAKYEGTRIGRQELYGELIDPAEAGIIRRSWFNLWSKDRPLPKFEFIIMSLDTAFTEKTTDKQGDPDPTACTVWGMFFVKSVAHVMLLDCWDDHLSFPDLMKVTKRERAKRYGDDQDSALIKPLFGSAKPFGSGRAIDMLLIEDKGSGISLRQTLSAAGIDAYAYNPGRADKLSRLHIVSPIFAQRRVWLPESEKQPGKPKTWVEPLVEQLTTFAGGGSIAHDDYVDASTQAIRVMMDKGLLALVKPTLAERNPVPQQPAVNPYSQ